MLHNHTHILAIRFKYATIKVKTLVRKNILQYCKLMIPASLALHFVGLRISQQVAHIYVTSPLHESS